MKTNKNSVTKDTTQYRRFSVFSNPIISCMCTNQFIVLFLCTTKTPFNFNVKALYGMLRISK
jgi:hypothetical protein